MIFYVMFYQCFVCLFALFAIWWAVRIEFEKRMQRRRQKKTNEESARASDLCGITHSKYYYITYCSVFVYLFLFHYFHTLFLNWIRAHVRLRIHTISTVKWIQWYKNYIIQERNTHISKRSPIELRCFM